VQPFLQWKKNSKSEACAFGLIYPPCNAHESIVNFSLSCCTIYIYIYIYIYKTELRGLSPHANYTDRAAAAGRRS